MTSSLIITQQQANGVFDSKKYWIETEDVITLGHANKVSLSSAILNFCGSFDILDTVENNKQTQEALKLKAIGKLVLIFNYSVPHRLL